MSNYDYKYELYDPYDYPNFSGYVITQSELLYVKCNYVIEQWELNPTGNDTNSLIKAAREEADLPRNAKIYIDDSEAINLDQVSDCGFIIENPYDEDDEDAEDLQDFAEHLAEL